MDYKEIAKNIDYKQMSDEMAKAQMKAEQDSVKPFLIAYPIAIWVAIQAFLLVVTMA